MSFTIVGVSPPGFAGLTRGSDYELRIPQLAEGRELPQMRLIAADGWVETAARLAPGVSRSQAEDAANTQLRDFMRTAADRRFHQTRLRALHLRPGGLGSDEMLQPFHATLSVLMTLAVMMTGNHYIFDAVAGAAVVLVSLTLSALWSSWSMARTDPAHAPAWIPSTPWRR